MREPESAAPTCTAESFASGHRFEHDPDAADGPGWPEGYDLCGRPADDPIHVGDEWTEPTWLETPTPPVDPDAADRAELLAHDTDAERAAYIAGREAAAAAADPQTYPHGARMKFSGTMLPRSADEAARPRFCIKVLTLTGQLCRWPVEYVSEGTGEVSGWYHTDRSVTADHHAVPNDWA